MHVTGQREQSAHLPPRWFIRLFWVVQRAAYAVTGGRFGLRTATADRWGMLRLRTVGRRSGKERTAILGYFEDGQDLVTMAMNGWDDPEPAWWLKLQAHPDATVVQRTGTIGHAYGPDGPSMTKVSTAMRPTAHEKPRSSSCRPDLSRGSHRPTRISNAWARPVGPAATIGEKVWMRTEPSPQPRGSLA